MASLWGQKTTSNKQSEDQKNAERIQDFINKFKIKSKDLDNTAARAAEKETSYGSSGVWEGHQWFQESIETSDDRPIQKKEYREMCKTPEINQSLNIYADNATQYNSQHNVLEIQSNNSKVVEILDKLFFETLDLNGNLWHYVRNTCKLGDEFLEVVVDNEKNPKHIISLERFKRCESMERIEEDGNLVKFVYTTGSEEENNKVSKDFQPWQVIHLKIEDEETEPYGKSVLEAGRKIWKKLSLMEDAMIIYRISRAPERRVFYIDVGNLSTKDANNHIETIKAKFKKKSFINPNTGEVDQKSNALSTDEDFFIGVRQNSTGTRIETLPGGANTGEIDDVRYFKNQLLSTLGIPPAYLGIVDQQASASYDPKSYLSNQEMQFSRTIERIQKLIIKGLEKIAILELVFNDIDEDELKNFKIVLTPPSSVEQLMDIEVMTGKFGLIQSIKGIENFLPDDWIYKKILSMSDEEIIKIKLQMQMQLQQQTQMQAALQNMAAGAGGGDMSGGGSMGGGGDMGGGGSIMNQPIGGGATPGEAGGGEGGMPAPEGGAEAPAEAPAAEGPALDVAHNYVEFDGTKWLLESKKDLNNLIKYINLYEKVNKDKYTDTHAHNRATRMTIKGEFRGLLQACKRTTKKNSLND